ncbi:protein TRANSPARENT TESTA 9 isoform X2 [Salvia miltiorrhiza]|uniref:protein TRANSPARENT TESTA 9 isoform X2 n=1 Tax=Salvia miltiorrhiza TaxID=226208 RepID=UPI0025AC7867|nr:protein TRANSPARENT TESTA 9 isoform X2 [Salvia miltiorrhiza]
MWFSFWRSRDRLSLDELRFIVDQLIKVQVVNEVNKDFVIEALRSIAELITYGDQHDAAYFEFFMEKQVMGEFVRILRICKSLIVSRQLLQTMSIMIQNLKSDHSIYYMFSNEHVNYLIAYPFDFRNEELLSYYISFLRAISGKLNKDTISLLVKTESDDVVDFPLYVEAIRFAFHEESMIRTAVRALTLNVYHVGDDTVNRFVSRAPHSDYFLKLIEFFRDRCIHLNSIVSNAKKSLNAELSSSILSAVDEIEDNLYYFSDVVSAGIPDVGRLIMDKVLRLLIFPLILPSFRTEAVKEPSLGAVTSLYLLCCILRIVKIKDLANIVAAALLCNPDVFPEGSEAKLNGNLNLLSHASSDVPTQDKDANNQNAESDTENHLPHNALIHNYGSMRFAPREALLSFVVSGDEVQVSGSLNVLATLLQTKELDESMVDALGILPQRKQHKKKLLQALVGEDSAEEQLFSSEGSGVKDGTNGELDIYLQKLKEYAGISCAHPGVGASPRVHRFQVLDSLVSLFCRSNISAETLWDGGWLLRQLLPYSKAEFNSHHLTLLTDSFHHCTARVLEEARGTWSDLLLAVICDEWRKCKRAIEASSPRKDPKCILLPPFKASHDEHASESSFAAGERMCEAVKVFALLHHLHIFSLGKVLPDQPPVFSAVDTPEKSRARNAGLNLPELKPNAEINLVGAIPCRIAFERGKERHFHFLALAMGSSGWLVLVEELPVKPGRGLVRVVAPLAGCNPRVDDKHLRWLHLRIRPSSFPFTDTATYTAHGKVKSKALVDGRWTLAFRDEESCKHAMSMVVEETELQSCTVEKSLEPLLELDRSTDHPSPS